MGVKLYSFGDIHDKWKFQNPEIQANAFYLYVLGCYCSIGIVADKIFDEDSGKSAEYKIFGAFDTSVRIFFGPWQAERPPYFAKIQPSGCARPTHTVGFVGRGASEHVFPDAEARN